LDCLGGTASNLYKENEMLVIVDYEMGNAASIMNMIRRVNTQTTLPVCISSNPSDNEMR